MKSRPVSLHVHRNRLENRRKRELAKDMAVRAERMARTHDIRAYAIIGIAADGKGYAEWDTGAVLPMWGFTDTMAAILRRDMENCTAEEDWKPAIRQGCGDRA